MVSGAVRLTVDGTVFELTADDSFMVPLNARHQMVNPGPDPAHLVFHLSPLAPRPELGHVDTEPALLPHATHPEIGGLR